MKVDGVHHRTIWDEHGRVRIIDQTVLPHEFRVLPVDSLEAMATAIRTMQLRGAPLIGAAAAYGVMLGMGEDPTDPGLARSLTILQATRPTAVNLQWALDRARERLAPLAPVEREVAALELARAICDEDVATNEAIGRNVLPLIRARVVAHRPVRILTHCNAGWLATVDWGTATAGVYMAHDEGLPVHVWVDETRPRRQGGRLTAWELGQHGVPHTVVPDTAAAHLMARGDVDLVVVGTDRTTARGDVANKIGTYAVALAAADNDVPFFVAAPSSSIDWGLREAADIPIEERSPDEVAWIAGRTAEGASVTVRVIPDGSPAVNYAFDVTPARLVTGIVTERGVAHATAGGIAEGLRRLFPERSGG